MKTFGRSLATLVALLTSSLAFAAQPPEQVPRQQVVQHQTGVIAVQIDQDQVITLVKQRHEPPAMIKMVLPAAENVRRTPWLEAVMPSGITKIVTVNAPPTTDGSHSHRMPSNVAFIT